MKKKLLAVVLCGAMALSMLAGCGGKKEDFCTACFDGDYPIPIDKYNCGKFVLEI